MPKRHRKSNDIVKNASDEQLVEAHKNCTELSERGCVGCPIQGGKCITLEAEMIRRFASTIEERKQIEDAKKWIASEKERLSEISRCYYDDGK